MTVGENSPLNRFPSAGAAECITLPGILPCAGAGPLTHKAGSRSAPWDSVGAGGQARRHGGRAQEPGLPTGREGAVIQTGDVLAAALNKSSNESTTLQATFHFDITGWEGTSAQWSCFMYFMCEISTGPTLRWTHIYVYRWRKTTRKSLAWRDSTYPLLLN